MGRVCGLKGFYFEPDSEVTPSCKATTSQRAELSAAPLTAHVADVSDAVPVTELFDSATLDRDMTLQLSLETVDTRTPPTINVYAIEVGLPVTLLMPLLRRENFPGLQVYPVASEEIVGLSSEESTFKLLN